MGLRRFDLHRTFSHMEVPVYRQGLTVSGRGRSTRRPFPYSGIWLPGSIGAISARRWSCVSMRPDPRLGQQPGNTLGRESPRSKQRVDWLSSAFTGQSTRGSRPAWGARPPSNLRAEVRLLPGAVVEITCKQRSSSVVVACRMPWSIAGDPLVAFRSDGVGAWMVEGPPELFFDAAMGRPGGLRPFGGPSGADSSGSGLPPLRPGARQWLAWVG
jgi:hypothetical protein